MSELDQLSFFDFDLQRRAEQETARALANATVKGVDNDDVVTWITGVGQIATTTAVIATIAPPNTDEDWEIIRILVLDFSSIDVNDRVVALYGSPSGTPYVELANGLFAAALTSPTAKTVWVWPNSGSTSAIANSQAQNQPVIVRRLDSTTAKLAIVLWAITTGTAGSRAFNVYLQVKKRRR
jgi:hypothetical protein